MANDHDKFTCGCDSCNEKYYLHIARSSAYPDFVKKKRKKRKKTVKRK